MSVRRNTLVTTSRVGHWCNAQVKAGCARLSHAGGEGGAGAGVSGQGVAVAGHHGVALALVRLGQHAVQAVQPSVTGQQVDHLPPEVLARQAVDEEVAGVVRETQRLHDLAGVQVGEEAGPGGVSADLVVAEDLAAGGEGQLQVADHGGRQLRQHQEEADGEEGEGGGRVARAPRATLLARDDPVAREADDLAQHQHVEDQHDERQEGEHGHVHHPGPHAPEAAVPARRGLRPGVADVDLRVEGPDVGLGRGEAGGEDGAEQDHPVGSPHRAPLLLEERVAHGHVALDGEGRHQHHGQVLRQVEEEHEGLAAPVLVVDVVAPGHVQVVEQVQEEEHQVGHGQRAQVHRRGVVPAHAPPEPDDGGDRVAEETDDVPQGRDDALGANACRSELLDEVADGGVALKEMGAGLRRRVVHGGDRAVDVTRKTKAVWHQLRQKKLAVCARTRMATF